MIITIDGQIATGKSTIAKQLAHDIGFIHFDTGAMYRSLTHGLITQGIDPHHTADVLEYLERFDFDIRIKHGERFYYVDGKDVTDAIRLSEVTQLVSTVAAIKEVREKLVDVQRHLARGVNAVFEGRDMGTVVFPDAEVKIFLSASPEIRAKRRYDELKEKYPDAYRELTLEKTLEDIKQRDHIDMTREASPLKKAEDAFEIDTSTLSIDEVIQKIQEYKDTKRTHVKLHEEGDDA